MEPILKIVGFVVKYSNPMKLFQSLSRKHSQRYSRKRGERFLLNWKEFKGVLETYMEQKDEALQDKYLQLKQVLEQDFNYFAPLIRKIQSVTHRGDVSMAMSDFEHCFSIGNIKDWESDVRRKVPNDIDCFDYLLISLVEYLKRPYDVGHGVSP